MVFYIALLSMMSKLLESILGLLQLDAFYSCLLAFPKRLMTNNIFFEIK